MKPELVYLDESTQDEIADPRVDVAQEAIDRLHCSSLLAACEAALPDLIDRRILELLLQEVPVGEIAREIGVDRSTVRRRRTKIRQLLFPLFQSGDAE